MKYLTLIIGLFLLVAVPTVQAGGSEFGDFLQHLNITAQADLGAFKAQLNADFGTPAPRIEALLTTLPSPADAYMCLKVSEVASQPLDRVVQEFNAQRGKGWGVIAGNLGIKPGSREFHALKEGRYGERAGAKSQESSKTKGHKK